MVDVSLVIMTRGRQGVLPVDQGVSEMPQTATECNLGEDAAITQAQLFAVQILRANSSLFYWTDTRAQMQDVVVNGARPARVEDYRRTFHAYDPCNIAWMIQSNTKTVTLTQAYRNTHRDHDIYRSYMSSCGVGDVLEMLFWADGKPFAGLGLLINQGNGQFETAQIEAAAAVQHYLEFNLGRHPRRIQSRLHTALTEAYSITRRELDVIERVRQGHSNLDIAQDLFISLSTVKCHLKSMFAKLAVDSRTELVARLRDLEVH